MHLLGGWIATTGGALNLSTTVAATTGNIWWWVLGIAAIVGLVWWWAAASGSAQRTAAGGPADPTNHGDGDPGQADNPPPSGDGGGQG